MTLYGAALFLHVGSAILLVAGGIYAHVALTFVPRADTVDGARAHARLLHTIVTTTPPTAVVVLVTGVYMAFGGSWWRAGWPMVSLVLFASAGASATVSIEPRVARLRAAIEDLPEGPITPDQAHRLVDPSLRRIGSILVGADLAIVFLMTNKPGLTGSMMVGATGLVLGAVVGVKVARRAGAAPSEISPPVPPTATA